MTEGTEIALMARSGSFNPCPVNTHTTVEPSGTPYLSNPATEADDAASQKTDSCWARKVYASMISSSVTAVMEPPDSVAAAVAKIFGDHDVSIRAMEQVGLAEEARLIFLTHVAREGDLLATIDELRRYQAVDRVSGVLRVIGERDDEGGGLS